MFHLFAGNAGPFSIKAALILPSRGVGNPPIENGFFIGTLKNLKILIAPAFCRLPINILNQEQGWNGNACKIQWQAVCGQFKAHFVG
ncbi:MAG: hypothetical protein WCI51_04695 [Lentisphaerota bacterium]